MWKIMIATTFVAVLFLACGCGVGKPVLIGERPEIAKLTGAGHKPVDCQVRVMPAVVSAVGIVEEKAEYAASGDAQVLDVENAVSQVLADFKVFSEVLPPDEAGQPYFDIQCEVSNYELAYEGRNFVYWPNVLFFWGTSPWVSWLVADEKYSASFSVCLRIKDAESGETAWREEIDTRVTKALDDYQRGTKWFSIFSIGTLTPENWKLVEATLRPHVVEEFKAKLLERFLSPDVQAALTESAEKIRVRRLPEADLAVVVGVNSCPKLGEKQPMWCRESAKQVAKALKEAGYRDVIELQDPKLPAIKAAIKKVGMQENFRVGRLLFYFAGVGASEYSVQDGTVQHFLLDCDAEKISLMELARLLEGVEASERALVLDAGFVPGKPGRGVALNQMIRSAISEFPDKITFGCGFLSACGPGQGAAEDDELKCCLFTHYLLKALASAASDADGDGSVSLKEIMESDPISFDFERRAKLYHGGLQKPFVAAKHRDNSVVGKKK